MEISTNRPKWVDYLLVIVGTFLMAIAVNLVYEPMDMVTGGVSGFAIVIKYWTAPLWADGIPIWFSNLAINVPLFLGALMMKGRKYIQKTLFGTIAFTVALYIVPSFEVVYQDYLLASVFGGIIMGAGLGLVFLTYSSTGGTDLFSALLHDKIRHYSIPQILMVIDGSIVAIGAVVFGFNKALYSIIAVYITSKIMDSILEGFKFAKQVYIISNYYNEIAEVILTDMNRGVTGINVQGMYSSEEKKMLFCVVSKKEVVKLVEIVAQKDPRAFVTVSDVREVLGEGFIEYRQ